MGRSQGVIRRLEALLMRWSFRDADQNAQNDSASRPDAGSFSLSVWLLGKSALPKERTADTVLAIGMLIVQVLIARNRYVSEREAEDRIQERRSPWPQ